jgi:hypothetical protein
MMLSEEQKIRQTAYAEAVRYMENAKETLQKARKEDDRYADKKYVRSACGIAYNGALVALDAFLELKGVEIPKREKRKSIKFYTLHLAKLDRKLLNEVNDVYEILHLSGYYDGLQDAVVIKRVFDLAARISSASALKILSTNRNLNNRRSSAGSTLSSFIDSQL